MKKIKPYAKNQKAHPDTQLKLIAKSLKEFGWRQPIVVDKDYVIIVGHGRWFAYEKYGKEMGIDTPRIETADNLTPQQVKAYRLADNKLNESDWDLELVIEELKELDANLAELTGFNLDMLENAEIVTKALEEWTDMPEYNNENLSAKRQIIVSFKCDEDIQKFATLLNQPLTVKTKSIWYPRVEAETFSDKRYE